MIYLDTSVVLAYLLAEDRVPPPTLWDERLVSSRLLEYEARTLIHRRGLTDSHGAALESTLQRIAFLELVAPVLEGIGGRVPPSVRTLDALHLASLLFLKDQGVRLQLATYDRRMEEGARAMGIRGFL
ncbi:MAG: PIN domain-containing protein [Gemmatimonadota bacterium]